MRATLWDRLKEHRFAAILGTILVSMLLSAGGSGPVAETCKQCVVTDLDDCGCSDEADCVDANCPDDLIFKAQVGDSPLVFEPNLGQSQLENEHLPYDYVSHQGRGSLFLSGGSAVLKFGSATIRASVVGASDTVRAEPQGLQTERVNYLLGNVPERWVTNVPTYSKVRYAGVAPGVDVVYYGNGSMLEHDLIVAPGTDPSKVQLKFDGVDKMEVANDGSIELHAGLQTVTWKKPVLYQMGAAGLKRYVEGRYKITGDAVAFETGVYDAARPLVIDPVVAFSTYYGRGGADSAARVATDASGNTYIVGVTNDSSFGYTGGAFLGSNTLSVSSGDVLITKISADGKSVQYATHIGGGAHDMGLGIAVDSTGIYFAGATNSTDYPLTAGPFQGQPAGQFPVDGGNCFVSKLNLAGSALIYSRLYGGSSLDGCTSLAIDSSGNAYVAGVTNSTNLLIQNGFQATGHANMLRTSFVDGFAAKFSPDGKTILYSTYIGGTGNDVATAIALDASGNAYITGATTSNDFPVSTGAAQTAYGGGKGTVAYPELNTGDAFLIKLSTTGARVYATYLGGTLDEAGLGVAVDAQGNAYVVGSTLSSDFPVQNAFQKTYGGAGGEKNYPCGDAFVTKVNPQGTALVYSSYLGGSLDDRAVGIAVDASGTASITGGTLSANFPVTPDALQKTYGGTNANDGFQTGDAFFVQVSSSGSLTYASYLGGSANDWGVGVTIDPSGAIIIAGGTDSTNFPTTTGSAQPRYGGGDVLFLPAGDAFISRFGASPAVSISGIGSAASYATQAVSPGEIVVLFGNGIGPSTLAGLQVAGGKLTTNLANTQILFDNVPAPLIYVSAGQSSAVVPYAVASRASTSVVVQSNGVSSAPVVIPVAAVVPALFSADSSGRGQGAILNQDSSPNSAANPALKGSVVQLFGTGEGQTTPGGVDGLINSSIFPKPLAPVSVQIGSSTITALPYAGAAPGSLSGFFQINVPIPLDAPSGSVPVTVIIGGVPSPTGLTVTVR